MKTVFIILWGSIMVLYSDISSATEVNIEVTGIDVTRGGNIVVMIFTEKGFPKNHKEAVFVQTKNALQEVMTFTFNPGREEMAVKVLHDENEDGKVSKNWTGIYPKEGLGFSNGQTIGLTGPPGYKSSTLSRDQFKDGVSISILYP